MVVLSLVNSEAWLVVFESDTVSDLSTEEHPGALHKVVHDILQNGLKRLLVDEVKVDFLISGDLESNVTSDEVDGSSGLGNIEVFKPLICLWILLVECNGAR